MKGLMMHCGADIVDVEAVYGTDTPSPEGRWFPVPHKYLVDEARKNLEASGFRVTEEAHALSHDGARYFGLMNVIQGDSELEVKAVKAQSLDWGLTVGLRNTHDKSYALGVVGGDNTFVCDNLHFSGEINIARKHTRQIHRDFPGLISRAIGMLSGMHANQTARVEAYKAREITDAIVHDAIVRAMRSRAIPNAAITKIVDQWHAPAHAEFQDRNVWSLQNAFTEVSKGRRLIELPKSHSTLQGILDPLAGFDGGSFVKELADVCGDAEDTVVR
jgi:hypothetical protein